MGKKFSFDSGKREEVIAGELIRLRSDEVVSLWSNDFKTLKDIGEVTVSFPALNFLVAGMTMLVGSGSDRLQVKIISVTPGGSSNPNGVTVKFVTTK